jgi:UDP-glucose 4-epimerase
MQLIHEDDLGRCLETAVLGDAEGLYNVAGSGSISWGEMASARGRRVFSAPAWLLYPATQLTWDLRLQSDSPALGLDFVRHRWLADAGKIEREVGFRPRFSSRDAWEAHVADGGEG